MSSASPLRRAGFTTFAASLLIAAVLFVLDPVASSTEVVCPGPPQLVEYAVRELEVWPPTVMYTDGCNVKTLRPSFVAAVIGALLGITGAVVGYAGEVAGRERAR